MEDTNRGLVARSQPAIIAPSSTDQEVIAMWLHGKSPHTQRAYRLDITQFLAYVGGCPLARVTLADVQTFSDHLGEQRPGRQRRAVAAVKSLFTFANLIGYLRLNPAAPVKLLRAARLKQRSLTEAEVSKMIVLARTPRNRLIIRLLYLTGCRVSELVSMAWGDLEPRESTGQVTILGKGQKIRTVLLPQPLWEELLDWRPVDAKEGDPLVVSRKGGRLDVSQVRRIVRKAAERAEIGKPISPHWLRHAHATHALERGCPLHLLQASLGHSSLAVTGLYLHARPSDSSSNYLIQL